MRVGTLMREMEGVTPPSQPFLHCLAGDYVEKKLTWNPHCLKKDALFYQFTACPQADKVVYVPDACAQFLFECNEESPRVLLVGIHLEKSECRLKPGCLYFVFKPYTYLGMNTKHVDISQFIDSFVDLTLVFPDAGLLLEQMVEAESFDERIEIMVRYANKELVDESYTPTLVDYTSVAICAAKGNVELGNLDSMTGYSSRYVRKRFKEAYGISPKQYSNIMRFQNSLKLLASCGKDSLSNLAAGNGYFDQAHFIHDFKKYATVTPSQFIHLTQSS